MSVSVKWSSCYLLSVHLLSPGASGPHIAEFHTNISYQSHCVHPFALTKMLKDFIPLEKYCRAFFKNVLGPALFLQLSSFTVTLLLLQPPTVDMHLFVYKLLFFLNLSIHYLLPALFFVWWKVANIPYQLCLFTALNQNQNVLNKLNEKKKLKPIGNISKLQLTTDHIYSYMTTCSSFV